MGNTPGVLSNCLQYFVHLNDAGWPIPGTMFSKQDMFKKDPGYGCFEAILPAAQMTIPAGHVQCFNSDHYRFFYKVNKATGKILPNSLWMQIGKPRNMCSGGFTILEYKQWI